MATTRREQPSFQTAVAEAISRNGLRVAKLPMIYNCRNVRHCRAATLKDGTTTDGCVVIHAHDFEPGLLSPLISPAAATTTTIKTTEPCPVLSGAHRTVLFLAPPRASSSTRSIVDAVKRLQKDNDVSVCNSLDERDPAAAAPCLEKSNKYAAVVAGAYPPRDALAAPGRAPVVVAVARRPRDRLAAAKLDAETVARIEGCLGGPEAETATPSCFATEARLPDDEDVKWFCGESCEGLAPAAAASKAADIAETFLLAADADRPDATVEELERALPSHFLRLSRHVRSKPHGRRRLLASSARHDRAMKHLISVERSSARHHDRASRDDLAALEAAFERANAGDAALYEAVRRRVDARRATCARPDG